MRPFIDWQIAPRLGALEADVALTFLRSPVRYSLPIPAVDTHRPKPASRKPSPASTPKIPGYAGGMTSLKPLTEGGMKSTVTTVPSTPRSYFGDVRPSFSPFLPSKQRPDVLTLPGPLFQDAVPVPLEHPPAHKLAQSPVTAEPVGDNVLVQPPTPKSGREPILAHPDDVQPRIQRSPTEF